MLITEILIEPDFEELRSTPPGQWIEVNTRSGNFLNICGINCMICLTNEPTNNLRGTWHAKILVFDTRQSPNLGSNWNESRYYFLLENAVREIESWLIVNKQIPQASVNINQ